MKGVEVFIILLSLPNILTTQYQPQYEKNMMCKDGYSIDSLLPDDIRFTCKPGPGQFVKCTNYYMPLKKPFNCPGFGYISGWYLVGNVIMMKCCNGPDLYYSPEHCRIHYNNDVAHGRCYIVDKDKVLTGYRTYDDGATYVNTECSYRTSHYYGYRLFKRKTY